MIKINDMHGTSLIGTGKECLITSQLDVNNGDDISCGKEFIINSIKILSKYHIFLIIIVKETKIVW
jgi:hypothetical protein